MEQALKSFIVKLKDVRVAKGISYEQIVDGCDQTVSLSTVKRIFAAGSEEVGSFRWATLQPIGYFLLGMEETEDYKKDKAPVYYSEAEALRADIEFRQKEKEMLEQRDAERVERISELRRQIKAQRLTNILLAAALAILLLTVLIVDIILPDVGFFFLR